LLDFKEGKLYAIEAEINRFREALDLLEAPKGTILVMVPGHEARASNAGRPLAKVAAALANTDRRYIPMIDGLIRTKTVLRRSTSAERSFGPNIRSMRVSEPNRLRSSVVIALDDTVTTGTTFAVVRCLLLEAGVSRVGAVALARTVKYF
jgi:predicted amidophosphoribosyltransferase